MTRAQDKDSRFKGCEGSDTGAGRLVVPLIRIWEMQWASPVLWRRS